MCIRDRATKYKNCYFEQLTLTVLSILSQLKFAKVELRAVLCSVDTEQPSKDKDEDEEVPELSPKEFYRRLETHCILSSGQKELLESYLDPLELCIKNPQAKFELSKLVELAEKQSTQASLRLVRLLKPTVLIVIHDAIKVHLS